MQILLYLPKVFVQTGLNRADLEQMLHLPKFGIFWLGSTLFAVYSAVGGIIE